MKLILLLVFLFNYFAYTQQIDLIGVPGGIVLKLKSHPSYDIIFAGLDGGSIFKSVDQGISNNFIDAKVSDFSINEISPLIDDSNYIFICAANLITLRSTNGGINWELISPSSWISKYVLNPLNQGIIFRTENNKEIWKSYNKGDTWFLLKSFNSNLRSLAISKTDTSILYAGADNTLYKTTDSGADWFRVLDSTDSKLIYQIEVNPYNKNSIYFYDLTNNLWKSEDGGYTYRKILNTDWTAGFVINPADTSILYSFNTASGIIKTTDEGLTWFPVNNGLPAFPNCIEINPLNPGILYTGIGNLGVFKTTNGGNNWHLTNLSYSYNIYGIWIIPPGKIEVGQLGWGIMKTTNNGKDWVQPTFVPNDFQSLQCEDMTFNPLDSSKGFLSTYLALGKTTDGGESWVSTYLLPGIHAVAYYPSNPDVLFAATAVYPNTSHIYKSTDGGETWEAIIDFEYWYEGVNKFYFDPVNTNVIYAKGGRKILKSTDGGLTWENKVNGIIKFGTELNGIYDFAIKKDEPDILYCCQRALSTDKGHLYKSTDGGENWLRIDSTLYTLDPMVSVSSILLDDDKPGRIYIGLLDHGQPLTTTYSNGGLYLTENDGKSWRKVYGGEVSVIKADYSSPRNIYFATKFGLMKLLDTLTVTSVENSNNTTPHSYYLEQNYPNPFNPVTTIKYRIPEEGTVTLKIYDLLGREIKTLIKEQKAAGRYEVRFDAGDLASGVYIYRLQVNDYVSSKKMILMK